MRGLDAVRTVKRGYFSRYALMLLLTVLWPGAVGGMEQRARANDSDSDYFVGVSKVDITPDYPIRLNGFGGRREESEGITQSIWAKGLAISSQADEPPLVLITLDSLGIRLPMVEEVAHRLAQKVGLPRDHLVVTFSHSHTTPKVNGASDTIFSTPVPPEHQAHIDRYTNQLTDWIEKAALAAIADRRPARMEWGIGRVGFAVNRRTPGGPVDHDLPVLVVRDSDSKVRAIYVTYACHCVTLSHNKISGDWAGYAQEALERQYPGAVALVSIGCGSDSNPSSGVTGDKTAAAAEQGAEIAREVERLLAGQLRPVRGALSATLRQIALPLDALPSTEQLRELAQAGGPAGYNAQWQLDRLARGESLLEAIDYPIQTWSFGDSLCMVFLAGEVCVDYSLRLKQELDPQRVWIHGYTNDFCAYIPSERLRQEGGYGGGAEIVYFALPAPLKPGLEQQIIDEVHRQVPQAFSRIADPDGTHGSRPKSPRESLETLRTRPELRVELVAAEPLVVDPVAIDFGPGGELWVVEMHDYPEGLTGKYDAGGRVKRLTDTDGDGQYDTATVFLEGLPFPTGISVWRKGVLVCAAPDILYAEDTTGDGRADIVEKRYQGFDTHNYQARVNSLRFGLDNHVYAAAGLFGGQVTNAAGQQADLRNRDFRMHPDSGLMEPVSGTSQQGRVRDDWGNWFGCDNGTLVRFYPLIDHYLNRNPRAIPPDPHDSVAPSNELFPTGTLVSFALSGPPGRATAACGIDVYRDVALGTQYYGNSFTCEPVNQLVHRLVLESNGTTFQGHRAAGEERTEFLTSTDNWFRPVQVRTGPDGALWIVDMYRYVIEHPHWIPKETLKTLNVRAGDSMGRIYRIVHREHRQPPCVAIERESLAELVAALDQTNGTQRDLIQQMLVWRADPASHDLLRQLVREGNHAAGRLQALCTLDGLGALDANTLISACHDPHPSVRRHAIRLAEPLLDTHPQLADAVLELVNDPAAEVHLQLAYSLGTTLDPRAPAALAQLARAHLGNDYVMAAIYSSVTTDNLAPMLALSAEHQQLFEALLKLAATMDDPHIVHQVMTTITDGEGESVQSWQMRVAAELVASLQRRGAEMQLQEVKQHRAWTRLADHARRVALDAEAPLADRVLALPLWAAEIANGRGDWQALGALLSPQYPAELQMAVVDAMAAQRDIAAADWLLEGWSGHSPAVRTRVLDAMLARDAWSERLLEAMRDGRVGQADVDATRRQQLRMHANDRIAKLAESVIQDAPNTDRTLVLKSYQQAIVAPGDAQRGREVFRQRCSVCHRLDDMGYSVGPDLAALTDRTAAGMLVGILDPNRAVDARYRNYVASTRDGESVQGILINETATSITLAAQEAKQRVLLRDDIEHLQATSMSLMPEGLESEIPVADMADLLCYLESAGARPKQIEGNQPEIVEGEPGTMVVLPASKAWIYGGDITFEPGFKNVGYWHGEQDHVVWRFSLMQAGPWDIYLDWACAPDSAGNRYLLQTQVEALHGVVENTGGYDRYELSKVGTVELSAGMQRIVVRPDGPLQRRALMDLRTIYLVPAGESIANLREPVPAPGGTMTADEAVRTIVDPNTPEATRNALLNGHTSMALDLLRGLADDSIVGTAEERRRIPWIWRLAIGAGRRNNADELRQILDWSMPQLDAPLAEYQAVVIGGGVINGISQQGVFPRARIERDVLGPDNRTRWQRAVELAAKMADDTATPSGTRYDALRMIAMGDWTEHGEQLTRYLQDGQNEELQMGAVSGLVDMAAEEAAAAIISALPKLHGTNRQLALEGMVRTEERKQQLVEALERGSVAVSELSEKARSALLSSDDPKTRERVRQLLAK